MYIIEVKTAFGIDETYTLDNLKKLYDFDKNRREREEITYSDLPAIFDRLCSHDTYPRTLIDPGYSNRKANVDYSHAIRNRFYPIMMDSAVDSHDSDHIDTDSLESVIRFFNSVLPNEDTSAFYRTAFFLTMLNWLLDYPMSEIDRFFRKIQKTVTTPFLVLLDDVLDISIHYDQSSLSRRIDHLIMHIERNIRNLVESEKKTEFEYESLLFFAHSLSFIQTVEISMGEIKAGKKNECYSYIAFFIAETILFSKKRSNLTGLFFAKKSLAISDPFIRQKAFLVLGRFAMSSSETFQLAYDAFYSWINRKIVGEIQTLPIIDHPFNRKDTEWRRTDRGRHYANFIRSDFSLVCLFISDTYEINCPRRTTFITMADKVIKKIAPLSEKKVNSYNISFSIQYAKVLMTQYIENPEKSKLALEQYLYYLNGSMTDSYYSPLSYISAANGYFQAIMCILVHSYMKSTDSFDFWYHSENVSSLWKELDKSESMYNISALTSEIFNEDEKNSRSIIEMKVMEKLLGFGKEYNESQIPEISCILLLLRQVSSEIQHRLRRFEYSTNQYFTRDDKYDIGVTKNRNIEKVIAYYTTLKNATHLFDPLCQNSLDQAPALIEKDTSADYKNCLTVMHAKYMNDPHEGLTLLNELSRDIDDPLFFPEGSAKQFRETVYNNTFVFLKSFTTKVDKLFMWNRYASDYDSDGYNSNGCCIQFDPEMINQIVSYSPSNTVLPQINDDYHLYRMVYISDDGKIDDKYNQDISDDVSDLYDTLRKLSLELNSRLKLLKSKDESIYNKLKNEVYSSLQQTLQSIMFLFKSDDYAEEDESRLILVRTPDQQESIRLLPGKPGQLSKLAINPYKQIYIRKIIFGPNVRNTDEWKPYLQYQLNKLWKKYASEAKDNSHAPNEQYSIENSKIHYRT